MKNTLSLKERTRMINEELAKKQKLTELGILEIKSRHQLRDTIQEKMETIPESDVTELQGLFKLWTKNEFKLQKLWNFPEDINFHKSWHLPKCTCPKLDNDERHPIGFYIRTVGCPIHNQEQEEYLKLKQLQ